MKDIDQLNSIFNLDKSISEEKLPISLSKSSEHDQENDYDLARQTLRNLIIKGEGTLDDMINFARNSEHPRAYEVASILIKTFSEVNTDLMNMHKTTSEALGSNKVVKNTTNNSIFVGSTRDLQNIINQSRSQLKAINQNEELTNDS